MTDKKEIRNKIAILWCFPPHFIYWYVFCLFVYAEKQRTHIISICVTLSIRKEKNFLPFQWHYAGLNYFQYFLVFYSFVMLHIMHGFSSSVQNNFSAWITNDKSLLLIIHGIKNQHFSWILSQQMEESNVSPELYIV